LVWSDGNIYGIKGNYQVDIDCGKFKKDITCNKLKKVTYDAAADLEKQSPKMPKRVDSAPDNRIVIKLVPAKEMKNEEVLGNAHITIESDKDRCIVKINQDKFSKLTPEQQESLIKHEAIGGHCMGRGHTTDDSGIMAGASNSDYKFTQEDIEILEAIADGEVKVQCKTCNALNSDLDPETMTCECRTSDGFINDDTYHFNECSCTVATYLVNDTRDGKKIHRCQCLEPGKAIQVVGSVPVCLPVANTPPPGGGGNTPPPGGGGGGGCSPSEEGILGPTGTYDKDGTPLCLGLLCIAGNKVYLTFRASITDTGWACGDYEF
jgi:hypothetical protein